MNNIDDIVYLKHILDAISRIGEYTKGVNYEDLWVIILFRLV